MDALVINEWEGGSQLYIDISDAMHMTFNGKSKSSFDMVIFDITF